jgi:excisionase family DNA binding protein
MTLNNENLPPVLKISAVARLLRWSRGKVYNQIRRGRMRSHKMGREHYVMTDELIEDLRK